VSPERRRKPNELAGSVVSPVEIKRLCVVYSAEVIDGEFGVDITMDLDVGAEKRPSRDRRI
jgi:hypothetical protein